MKKSLIASIPHAGEIVPDSAFWLKNLPEQILMYDVDRFIDQMYEPVLKKLNIPCVTAKYHRYAVDCNRWPSDVDRDSVEGAPKASGRHPTGLHWRITTAGRVLIKKPLKQSLHEELLKKYYYDFFKNIDNLYKKLKENNFKKTYHLNLHSMPSQGTSIHRDPGQSRTDIVIGNEQGKTADSQWTNQVKKAYENQGFSVSLNSPYTGGTDVEKYGKPDEGHQALMIELNRKLYMNEKTKQIIPEKAGPVKERLSAVIEEIYDQIV